MAARKTPKPPDPAVLLREAERQLLIEEAAFDRQLKQLLKKYEGQYVAVYKGRVVDHDANESTLFGRVLKKLGDVVFLIARVERTPTIYVCPSLELKW
jgi:hypothetical protein